jgi:hypothetical protein
VVYLASQMRATGTYIHDEQWIWMCQAAGQQLFYPPNVSGWDDNRWLDTNTMRGRWLCTFAVLGDYAIDPWNDDYDPNETSDTGLDKALARYDYPPLRSEQQNELLRFGNAAVPSNLADWQEGPFRAMRENASRLLIGVGPDMQLS